LISMDLFFTQNAIWFLSQVLSYSMPSASFIINTLILNLPSIYRLLLYERPLIAVFAKYSTSLSYTEIWLSSFLILIQHKDLCHSHF
jgi:hypothetical protein